MNEQPSDPVFDSLIAEMLTGQHPPDLSSRIISAWRDEQNAEKNQTPQKNASPNLASPSATPIVKAIPIAPPIRSGNRAEVRNAIASPRDGRNQPGQVQLNKRQPTTHRERSSRGKVAFGLASCAVGLLVVLGWLALARPTSDLASTPGGGAVDAAGMPAADALAATAKQPPGTGSTEVLELDNLPFSVTGKADVPLNNALVGRGPRAEPISNQQVVAQLDQQFEQLWSKLGVVPNPNFEMSTQAQRISMALTGAALSESQLQWWSSERASNELLQASLDTANTPKFAQHWGRRFAAQWLTRGEFSADRHEASELENFLANSLATNRPWDQVVFELLGSELAGSELAEDGAETATSQTHLAFMTALAGGENHRLVEQIGRNFLDANLSCIRCHDATANPARSTEQQETYWSLVAVLKGIDVQLSPDGLARNLIDQQPELFANGKSASVFFDLPNGVLKASSARLPNGDPWNSVAKATPRQALADWIVRSPEFDRASVNQAWKLVFGRPLVPQSAGLENAATAERTAILELLATQFRAHHHDLKLLVSWIVNSRPYSVQPVNLNKSQWLAATDAELDLLQLSELVFAAGPSLGRSPEAESLESSLAAAVEWNQRAAGEYRAMLAQPASLLIPEPGTATPAATPAVSKELPSLGYAIHGERQTLAQRNFVNRILRAGKLSWEERVEHVVGLSGDRVADSHIQHLAKILLEQNSGDAKSTLLRILWAVQNSDAG